MSRSELRRFASEEIDSRAEESVRGADVFVVQSHYEPVNEALMEQLIMIDVMKRASAKRINAVIPFYGYSRQDHKALSRTDQRQLGRTSSRRPARTGSSPSTCTGASRYFDFPFDHLTALPILSAYFKDDLGLYGDNLVVVAPDAGRIKTSEKLREHLHADLAFLYKRRIAEGSPQDRGDGGRRRGAGPYLRDRTT